jgi:membrane-bound lytic murein transglycosylase D
MKTSGTRFLGIALALILSALMGYASVEAAPAACVAPHLSSLQDGFRYSFPPDIEKDGLVFAQSNIPIHRKDVRNRILREVNYLLQDRRSKVLLWLGKVDGFRPVVAPILKQYDLPPEFMFLAAIESSYNSRALSSAGAYGFWQFIKATAVCGPQGCDQYDWKMNISNWRDERADLKVSTHAAARYLAWLNRIKRVSVDELPERDGFGDWLLSAAAYNAGPKRVTQQMSAYKATTYWDTPLPAETEKYVPRLIAIWLIHRHRDFYGAPIQAAKAPSFDTVENVKLQKDLTFVAAAKLLNSTPREVWSLNTQIAPEKGVFPAKTGRTFIQHTINVPKGAKSKFLSQLAAHGYTKK